MKLHIIIIVEHGILEQQAMLAINSVQTFIDSNLACKIWAVSPRSKEHHPCQSTVDFLIKNNVTYIDKQLNNDYDYFPLCNGIYATELVESFADEGDYILLIDTDTLFINSIDPLLFQKEAVCIRPVDNKGIGSTGHSDSNDTFWLNAFELFGIQPNQPKMVTTVDRQIIRPYYNSGFVLAPKSFNFFCKWRTVFEKLMESSIRTSPSQSRHKVDFGFIEQMSISITLSLNKLNTNILPNTYNYPLPFMPVLSQRENNKSFPELIHIHYHRWFQHPDFLNHILNSKELKSKQYEWLKNQLPLTPVISDSFKR